MSGYSCVEDRGGKGFGDVCISAGQDVAVDVERDTDAGVAEPFTDHLTVQWVCATVGSAACCHSPSPPRWDGMSANERLTVHENVPPPRLRPGVGRVCGFVALTFALTWGLWIPVLLADPDAGPWALVLGGFGPALAAAVMVRVGGGKVWSWLRSIVGFRMPASRYAAAVGIPLAFVVIQLAAAAATGTPVAFGDLPMALLGFVAVFVLVALVGGGQEEFGWRGWLQPALQERWTPLGVGVTVGIVWAAWHAPLFWLYPAYESVVAVFYVPTIVALSVIIAFLWNRSRQSVVIAIAMHASFNASNELFTVGEQATSSDVQFVAQVVLAIATVGVAVALAIRHGRQLGRPVHDTAPLEQT